MLAAVLHQQLPDLELIAGSQRAAPAEALRLPVAVEHCEGDAGDHQVHFQAHWRLEDAAGKILARGDVALTEPWAETDASALVAAQDRILARFGTLLAKAVTAVLAAGGQQPAAPL